MQKREAAWAASLFSVSGVSYFEDAVTVAAGE